MNPAGDITIARERGAAACRSLCAVLALGLLAGCQGRGRVELASLNYREIDPPSPRFSGLDLERCYWWTDEAGQVWIALEHDKPWLLLGGEHFVFQLSLVLEKPPAGHARNYLVSKRELRGVARFGPVESRFVSLAGVVALYRESSNRLRGSFRLDVARQAQEFLGGWSPGSRYLMLGTFEAVPDEQQGRRIAAATEAFGWDRQPPTASQPSTLDRVKNQPATRPVTTRPEE